MQAIETKTQTVPGVYPRRVTLHNDKLKGLLVEKGSFIAQGRKASEEIEAAEKEMEAIDQQIQAIEKGVDIKDLTEEANLITKEVEAAINKMEGVKKRIFERMNKAVPQELRDKYEALKTGKDEKETLRNKFAMKAQKINDRVIPIARKLMKLFIQDEYEDYETLGVENGEVVGTIFSHLNDFKVRFHKK